MGGIKGSCSHSESATSWEEDQDHIFIGNVIGLLFGHRELGLQRAGTKDCLTLVNERRSLSH